MNPNDLMKKWQHVFEPKMWIVGKLIGQWKKPPVWEFQGVFDTQERADKACKTKVYFYFSSILNQELPDTTVMAPDCCYPRYHDISSMLTDSLREIRRYPEEKRKVFKILDSCRNKRNDWELRRHITRKIAKVYQKLKNVHDIYDYQVVCDETNNTPAVIDNNQLRVLVKVKPLRSCEVIQIRFTVAPTKK